MTPLRRGEFGLTMRNALRASAFLHRVAQVRFLSGAGSSAAAVFAREPDVWYRIHLTVRDSGGLTTTVFRDVQPRKVQLTFATSPAGLSLRLDGQPRATPFTVTGVVGVQRTLEAPSPQTIGGKTYVFVSWSDGGGSSHTISTPASSTTYTATFRKQKGRPLPGGTPSSSTR